MSERGELWLVRHGETAWSLSGAHTGRTDLPLTAHGEQRAQDTGRFLNCRQFALVLTSPMQRARETCRLAGYAGSAQVEPDLMEWDYGEYEGLSTRQIREGRPDWDLWLQGPVGGETVEAVGQRADRVIERAAAAGGDVLMFAHGHILRILGARWIGLPAGGGRMLGLSTATISTLGYERERRVITLWNRTP